MDHFDLFYDDRIKLLYGYSEHLILNLFHKIFWKIFFYLCSDFEFAS
jgi:hypothetical protein